MDQVFGTLCLIVISLSLSIYVGWIWKTEPAVEEISEGCPWFKEPLLAGYSPAQVWAFFVKYICPVVISLVLVNALGLFDQEKAAPTPDPEPEIKQAAPTQTSPEDNASSPTQ